MMNQDVSKPPLGSTKMTEQAKMAAQTKMTDRCRKSNGRPSSDLRHNQLVYSQLEAKYSER
jgi:hypothetical protein